MKSEILGVGIVTEVRNRALGFPRVHALLRSRQEPCRFSSGVSAAPTRSIARRRHGPASASSAFLDAPGPC